MSTQPIQSDALAALRVQIDQLDAELLRIASLSLLVSGAATAFAAAIGIPLGIALHVGRFPGRAAATVLVNASMALPPVVVGLVVMLVLWRTGPLGSLRLLFTPTAMVVRVKGKRVPDAIVAGSNYVVWVLVSGVVAWIFTRGLP